MNWVVKFENGFVNEYEDGKLKHSVRASAIVSLTRASPHDTVSTTWGGGATYVGVGGDRALTYHTEPSEILAFITNN
jgi:hypothetical protein